MAAQASLVIHPVVRMTQNPPPGTVKRYDALRAGAPVALPGAGKETPRFSALPDRAKSQKKTHPTVEQRERNRARRRYSLMAMDSLVILAGLYFGFRPFWNYQLAQIEMMKPRPVPAPLILVDPAIAMKTAKCVPTRLNMQCNYARQDGSFPNEPSDTLYGRTSSPESIQRMIRNDARAFHRAPK
jgi:hypothetical protein